MTKRPLKNVASSVRERLLNEAKKRARTFNEVLQYFAIERFLFRLAQSPHATKFVLKGAIMLSAWRAPLTRPTMDVDLLGRTANDVEAVAAIFRDVCAVVAVDDGLTFDPATLEAERIAEDAMYGGVRVRVRGQLGTARVVVQVDVASEIASYPSPSRRTFRRSSTCHARASMGTRARARSPRSLRPWSSSGRSTAA